MNTLEAIVKDIQNVDNLHIIKCDFFEQTFTMMTLDLPNGLKTGSKVVLNVKPTSVAIAKKFSGMVSFSNRLPSSIISIDKGELLASIVIKIEDVMLQSIITLGSLKRMDLKVGDEVEGFIKASDLSVLKIAHD